MAPRIVNLAQWREHVLTRLRQRQRTEPRHTELLAELSSYPGDDGPRESTPEQVHDIFVPLHLRHDGRELRFFATFATFGAALDITVAELSIESFFPADEQTARVLRGAAGGL
jgi:hypothetical protein